ncbi:SusD/RagB family nutrient-binding outer membrane lipoprotein [Flavilitoribacter nigricans]|uniref:SusD/RagB family nutrient-binding outer membrane lipoprotein n=1 Tax=Flavilitoribacter nigricans (strain ATCC 23147 / DSM 23189 / NBRC 102662 / NCIMB 1420 / SS-2) TaxID=1122177 RepID=A0A2D0NFH3_FLAN2|nr:SusD/RagB family nutrient-binding outer membrane lipoprotein [Flavilitoribacter nigricans]PHN07227.1 SusD/RagB family nutrient-binding outer membrane lipoprotein [Flavilitoribacter nigricans DSM 23189 = NBRC 102662]
MKFFNKMLIVALVLGFSACDNFELDLQDNPNAVTPENASVNDLYNNVQLSFNGFFNSLWGFSGSLTRMIANTGAYDYQNAYSPTSFDGIWTNAYAGLLADIDALIELADSRGLDIHAGSAKVMKAYTFMALVDIFADVPYTDALQGSEVLSPSLESGQTVYAGALATLDEAIAQLGSTSAARPVTNLYNNGSAGAWLKVANTLKLRAALTTRLVDPSGSASTINALVSGGNIIDEASEDFQFNYGNQRNNPNSRHPFYNNSYENADGTYMSTYYMWLLRGEKETADGIAVIDPRIRYYFYRQVEDANAFGTNEYSCHFTNLPDQESKPAHFAQFNPRLPYCIIPNDGYWGRDHLNNEGIPPDGNLRTVYGLYPGGGQFDDSSFDEVQQLGTTGGLGQGISPILLSSFTAFMRAEAALTIGTNDDARAMLEEGVRASIAKVQSFGSLVPATLSRQVDVRGELIPVADLYVPTSDDVDAYVDFVLGQYDAAASDDERLNVIAKEYLIALWGNGIEAYNMYRRTGKPDGIAPSLEPGAGAFIRSAFLPAVHVNRNATTSGNKPLTQQVFWDTNPADFVY